ncbi:MAG TPA: PHP domain-containing protein [Bacillota bacterium]|nr:PHP domain-containing protein [Bacillota bacterium]HOK68433.1 PHP domain-containing protein [Bacillota bacterium]HPP85067.1 PHP domain-containing protein [Bacillota bacterium]
MYKFDTHVHTAETSPCGKISAAETVRLYKEAGYSGICITDHYTKWLFESFRKTDWKEAVDRYLEGYRSAKEYGDRHGMDVLLGAEVLIDGTSNDYLLFGLSEEILYDYPRLYAYAPEELSAFAKKHNLLLFQAHPFRSYVTAENPLFLDGVEVFNGNPRHDSRNDLALRFAQESNLLMSGGSDFHQVEDVGRSGIMTDIRIKDAKTFVEVLKSGRLTVIRTEN